MAVSENSGARMGSARNLGEAMVSSDSNGAEDLEEQKPRTDGVTRSAEVTQNDPNSNGRAEENQKPGGFGGNGVKVQNQMAPSSDGNGKENFKRDIRNLEELLSKLNPMAEEFVPHSIGNTNNHWLYIANEFGYADGFVVHTNYGRKKNNYGRGKRRMNSRTSQAQQEEVIRRTVYVSDLDQQVTEEQLAALFNSCGQVVDCRVCGDPKSMLHFAFVEFTDEEGTRAALDIDGTVLGYYPIRVLPSKTAIAPVNPTFLPRDEDEREMCLRTIYCTNIDRKVTQADLKLFFESTCGEVYRLRLLGDFHHSTCMAFVEFVMVRSFNIDLLHPMYQARTHKAALEFFHIGGQQVDNQLNTSPESGIEAFPHLFEKEFVHWESNILWSLKQCEDPDKPLVIWDITTALSAFKRSAPKYVERILVKWLLISYVGSHVGHSIGKVLLHVSENISKIASRKLHLLNVICRRVLLSKLMADEINGEVQNLGSSCDSEEEEVTLWIELLLRSERELRERLVAFTFSAFAIRKSRFPTCSSQLGYWYPVGLMQMDQWIAVNHDSVHAKLKALASEIKTQEDRLESGNYAAEEQCSYCSEPVPFESPEVAFCQGVKGDGQNHKLARCAVSMQVCPTTPLWSCVCCHRRASTLPPENLFILPSYPSHLEYSSEFYAEIFPKALCPFCGILLQRSQPDFLLSALPV